MERVLLFIISLVLAKAPAQKGEESVRRNIVFIISDDLGWNDVSLHGSDQIQTPNIDMLGYSGVTLGRYYTHCACTPSRAAILTGKYAHVTGMQGFPLLNVEDRGLPVTEKILPQYFKELGYATHLVGKWHLGSSRHKYLPTKRGFDTHFGHRGGFIDYYEYTEEEEMKSFGKVSGLDLYRNDTAAWDVEGYITDVYNQEALSIIKSHDASTPLLLMMAHNAPHGSNEGTILQAPPKDVRAMRHVELTTRRFFAATMKKLDDSVGDVIEALEKKGILNNTIIVFISDNGAKTSGMHLNYGSNWPLRGIKRSPFEGAIRVTGALWVPFELTNHLYMGYIHAIDWLPTLLNAVGAKVPQNIDGIDLWENIIGNTNSSRHEIFEIDDYANFSSMITGEYKLVTGNVNHAFSNYQGADLLGIVGNVPIYLKSITNSKAYKMFQKIGHSINIEGFTLRERVKVECKPENYDKNVICYPENGKVCLYNIMKDPCEMNDLSQSHSNLVNTMLARLKQENKRLKPRQKPYVEDARSRPALFNYTWSTFADAIS